MIFKAHIFYIKIYCKIQNNNLKKKKHKKSNLYMEQIVDSYILKSKGIFLVEFAQET